MKQTSLGLGSSTRRTRKRQFLDEMERVMQWAALVALIAPHLPAGQRGRPPFPVEAMLRIHFMQQWFTLSDPPMEEALHDVPLFRDFAGLGGWDDRLPDEATILPFRHLLEKNDLAPRILRTVNDVLRTMGLMLRAGTVGDAALIAAPSSTKSNSGQRDPEMKQSKKGNQWFFGMEAHIGVDAHSGLVHSVAGTAANVNDVTQAGALLHGQEDVAFGDAGYQGVHKRPEAAGPTWHVAMRPGLRCKLNPFIEPEFLAEQAEKFKASVRAKVEHPFRVLKRQFGFTKARYRGLKKNTAQIVTLFALSNLWMARRHLMGARG